jgi:hypothetical protein
VVHGNYENEVTTVKFIEINETVYTIRFFSHQRQEIIIGWIAKGVRLWALLVIPRYESIQKLWKIEFTLCSKCAQSLNVSNILVEALDETKKESNV